MAALHPILASRPARRRARPAPFGIAFLPELRCSSWSDLFYAPGTSTRRTGQSIRSSRTARAPWSSTTSDWEDRAVESICWADERTLRCGPGRQPAAVGQADSPLGASELVDALPAGRPVTVRGGSGAVSPCNVSSRAGRRLAYGPRWGGLHQPELHAPAAGRPAVAELFHAEPPLGAGHSGPSDLAGSVSWSLCDPTAHP